MTRRYYGTDAPLSSGPHPDPLADEIKAEGKTMTEDIVAMARAAQRDDRLADGALYGKLADEIERLRQRILSSLSFEELEAEYVRRAQRS